MPTKLLISLLVTFSLFMAFAPRSTARPSSPIAQPVEYVYLCEGPKSVVYHASSNCRGLSHCSTKIYKVTLAEALKEHRRPCKIEYR